MLTYGPLHSDIDLESDGRRVGRLWLDHSDNENALALIPIPIAVLRNGSGPTVLVTAAVHGDEYEGQAALRRLIHEIGPEDLRGRLIVLPAVNAPAALAGARVSPLDGGNLNRAFPGAEDGGPTKAIAGFLLRHILPHCDCVLDLHSGGKASRYVDLAYLTIAPDRRMQQTLVAMAEAFAAPFTLLAASSDTPTAFDQAAHQAGVPLLSTELGGGGEISPASLTMACAGLRRVLHWAGLLRSAPAARQPTRFVGPAGSALLAPRRGLYAPLRELGSEVLAGEPAGHLLDFDEPERPPEPLTFPGAGVLIMKRVPTPCAAGSILHQVACPASREEALALP